MLCSKPIQYEAKDRDFWEVNPRSQIELPTDLIGLSLIE